MLGYYFRPGSNQSVIPTFGTLDANLSLRIPRLQNMLLNPTVNNLFSCTATGVTYKAGTVPANSQIASENRKCGSDRRHIEMVNMPAIGTMAFLGVRLAR